MKVVVTGGAGFVGSHLVDALVARGCNDVWVIDNLYRGSFDNLSKHSRTERVTFTEGDIREREQLKRAFENADVVFHLAAQSNVLGSVQDPDYAFSTNVVGTYNVLSEAATAGVSRVVFTSSTEVYGEPPSLPVRESAPLAAKNHYGASKIAAEVYCQVFSNDGPEVVVLRLANVYGPRDGERVIPLFVEAIFQGKPITIYGEKKVLDFIWVGDVVQVLVEAAFRAEFISEPLNVASGVGTRLTDLAEAIGAASNRDVVVQMAAPRAGEVNGFVADVSRMHDLFGVPTSADPLGHLNEVIKDLEKPTLETAGAKIGPKVDTASLRMANP